LHFIFNCSLAQPTAKLAFMRAERFVTEHRAAWKRLDELVKRAQRERLAALSDDELLEMGQLYRRAASDLARAQTRYTHTHAGRELARSLNDLVLRAHTQLYASPAAQTSRALHFLLYAFPAAFRRNWKPIALAAVFLYLPALLAYLTVFFNHERATLFVPDHVIAEVQQRAQKKLVTGWGGNTSFQGVVESPEVSSYIMVNNIRVSAMAAALGVTAGVGTFFVLVMNGMMVGGLAGSATHYNVDLLFWSVILPHGVIELTAICIAGGAGLVLARAIYAPGDLPRRDALKIAGGEAAILICGVAAMLVIAGIIEGFITPQPISPYLKLGFSFLTGVLLLVYLNARPKELPSK
jgi:uncharacterized membrane protein SpoIIM required for sporulation